MTTPALPAVMRHQLAEQDRLWRMGYEAGLKEHRRLLVVGAVVGLFVFLRGRRRLHPFRALLWATAIVLALSPVLVAALAVNTVVRTHRAWGSGHRTFAVALSWLGAFALLAAAVDFAWPVLLLVMIPGGAVVWLVDGHLRMRRSLRFTPPPPPPFPL